jgi:acetolactate synthase-1/2/3 large subunit
MLRDARRPVVLAGAGVLREGAQAELLALANRIRTPVATIPGAPVFPRDHVLFLSEYGFAGVEQTAWVVGRQADLMLFLGVCRDGLYTGDFLGEALARKRLIRVPGACPVGRELRANLLVEGNIAEVLAAIHEGYGRVAA